MGRPKLGSLFIADPGTKSGITCLELLKDAPPVGFSPGISLKSLLWSVMP